MTLLIMSLLKCLYSTVFLKKTPSRLSVPVFRAHFQTTTESVCRLASIKFSWFFHFYTEMRLVHQQRFPTSEDIAFWDYKVSSCPVIFAWFILNFENQSNNCLGSLTILQNLQALSHTNFFAEPVRVVAIVLFQNSWHLK